MKEQHEPSGETPSTPETSGAGGFVFYRDAMQRPAKAFEHGEPLRCAVCGKARLSLPRATMFAVCDAKHDGRRCYERHYLLWQDGRCAAVRVTREEWDEIKDADATEASRALWRLGIVQAAHRVLSEVDHDRGQGERAA